MNDKRIAIVAVVVIVCAVCVAAVFAESSPVVSQLIQTAAVGGGIVVTLFRIGVNTEITERVERNSNGIMADRVAAAFREGYSRGKIDGAQDEVYREAIRVKALADAATAIKNVGPGP